MKVTPESLRLDDFDERLNLMAVRLSQYGDAIAGLTPAVQVALAASGYQGPLVGHWQHQVGGCDTGDCQCFSNGWQARSETHVEA